MTPTNQDKLYALAVCAGHCAKSGSMEKLVSCVNTMATIITDEDIEKSREIFSTLDGIEAGGVEVKQFIKAERVDGPDIEDPFKSFSA